MPHAVCSSAMSHSWRPFLRMFIYIFDMALKLGSWVASDKQQRLTPGWAVCHVTPCWFTLDTSFCASQWQHINIATSVKLHRKKLKTSWKCVHLVDLSFTFRYNISPIWAIQCDSHLWTICQLVTNTVVTLWSTYFLQRLNIFIGTQFTAAQLELEMDGWMMMTVKLLLVYFK